MSFFKNAAIKAVTKKRTRQFTSLVEMGLNADKFQQGDMNTRVLNILNKLIDTIESQENAGSLNINREEIDNWKVLLFTLVVQSVRVELSYDKSIGADKDYDLIAKTFDKEMERWRQRSHKLLNLYEQAIHITSR